MTTIDKVEEQFASEREKNPLNSTLISLATVLKGKKLSKGKIKPILKRLVDDDDYDEVDTDEILDYLFAMSSSK